MNPSGSMFSLLTQGGLLSVLVLIVLVAMSVLSWAIIIKKWFLFKSAIKKSIQFLYSVDYKSGFTDILHRSKLYAETFAAALFHAAYDEFSEIKDQIPMNR